MYYKLKENKNGTISISSSKLNGLYGIVFRKYAIYFEEYKPENDANYDEVRMLNCQYVLSTKARKVFDWRGVRTLKLQYVNTEGTIFALSRDDRVNKFMPKTRDVGCERLRYYITRSVDANHPVNIYCKIKNGCVTLAEDVLTSTLGDKERYQVTLRRDNNREWIEIHTAPIGETYSLEQLKERYGKNECLNIIFKDGLTYNKSIPKRSRKLLIDTHFEKSDQNEVPVWYDAENNRLIVEAQEKYCVVSDETCRSTDEEPAQAVNICPECQKHAGEGEMLDTLFNLVLTLSELTISINDKVDALIANQGNKQEIIQLKKSLNSVHQAVLNIKEL